MSNWNCCNRNTACNINVHDGCGCREDGTITLSCGGCGRGDVATIRISAECGGGCQASTYTRNACDCGSAWTSQRCGCRSWNTGTGRNNGCGCGHENCGHSGHEMRGHHGCGCGCW